ncbi:MAG TPA: prepilin-type N-terminal cleavage/methylation domain-containing protein [Kofleriaceae bacterium]
MAADRVDSRPQGGFTIIEVMVAILLTALTVIGVLGLFRIETRASAFSRRETEAAVLAQDKLEELRTQLAPSADSSGNDTPTDQLSGTSFFARAWTIAVSGDPDVYNIQVDVTWDEDGATRTVTVRGQRGGT